MSKKRAIKEIKEFGRMTKQEQKETILSFAGENILLGCEREDDEYLLGINDQDLEFIQKGLYCFNDPIISDSIDSCIKSTIFNYNYKKYKPDWILIRNKYSENYQDYLRCDFELLPNKLMKKIRLQVSRCMCADQSDEHIKFLEDRFAAKVNYEICNGKVKKTGYTVILYRYEDINEVLEHMRDNAESTVLVSDSSYVIKYSLETVETADTYDLFIYEIGNLKLLKDN